MYHDCTYLVAGYSSFEGDVSCVGNFSFDSSDVPLPLQPSIGLGGGGGWKGGEVGGGVKVWILSGTAY